MGKLLALLGDGLACFITIIIVSITVLAVFMRYVLGDPLQWVEEVLIALFIWMIMLGAASAMRVRGHVSIDAITSMFSHGIQRKIQVFNDILSIVILGTLGWLGLELALEAGEKITPIIGISYTYIDLAVPVGCFLMVLYVLIHMYCDATTEVQVSAQKEEA